MIGALSSREYQDLVAKKKSFKADQEGDKLPSAIAETKEDSLDEGEFHWDTELTEVNKEKQRAFNVLAQFVPQSEIFFNHMGASKQKEQQKLQ